MGPPFGNAFVIQQYENYIEKNEEESEETEQQIDGFWQQGPEPGNGFLDGVQHILFLEQLGDKLGVYVLTKEFRECFGHIAVVGSVGKVVYYQIFYPDEFVHHGRHKQIEGGSSYNQNTE